MTVAVRLILICCLFQGVPSQDWTAFIPRRLDPLSGSCVVIPCSFNLGSGWNSSLDDSCKAIWIRRSWRELQVFDSSLTGALANSNILQGNLTGDLLQKDCTTIFYNLPSNRYDDYFFRLECDNSLKYTFRSTLVHINVKDSLPIPTITPSSVEVEEGSSVILNCSAQAPCPILPPNLTWTPGLGHSEEKLENQVMTSVLNFTASPSHHRQEVSCTSLYKRQAGNSDLSFERSLTIIVFYPPSNTSISPVGHVLEGSAVTLTCSSNANPVVKIYTWYHVNGDLVTSAGSRRRLIIVVSAESRQFYCEARNKYGAQNSSVIQIDVQFPPKNTTVLVEPPGALLEGTSVTLTCDSHANPTVQNYTWYRVDGDAAEIVESGQKLTIDSVNPSHTGEYYCKAKNDHGEERATVQLDIQYPPKNTSVSVSPSGPVADGSPVTLSCSSIANPAVENFTWFRLNEEKEAIGWEEDFTFNATKLSPDQYYCEARNGHGSEDSEFITVDVLFPPEILQSSQCVTMSTQVRCSCESHGNPLPSLGWELAGQPINHSADIPIREVIVGRTGRRSFITMRQAEGEMPSLVCLSNNKLGFDSLALNMTATEGKTGLSGLHPVSLMIGSAVGAVGMMLFCVLLQLIFYRKRKASQSANRGLEDMSELVTNGTASVQVESIYANKSMLEGDDIVEGDNLHYANVDFKRLKASSGRKQGDGEIRGLASKTAEYAEIRLAPRASAGEEAELQAAVDSSIGQEKDTSAHIAEAVEQTTADEPENGGELSSETKEFC